LENKGKVVKLTCIVCPIGCEIKVTIENDNIVSIDGNKCPNGEKYAKEEVVHPKRLVFTVLKCKNGNMPTVAVKTSKPVSKFLIPSVMKYLSNVEVSAPLNVGDVIVQNILDSGADVVVTRSVNLLEYNS
jgi:CxxC motif-containing protein